MKQLYLRWSGVLLLALALAWPAAAQDRPAAAPPLPVAADGVAQAAREDTTYAVQRLFRQRRHRYRLQTIIWGATAGLSAAFPVAGLLRKAEYKPNVLGLAASAYALGRFGYSYAKLYPYRTRRERKLLAAVQAGRPLPAEVRRQLTANYFDAPLSSK